MQAITVSIHVDAPIEKVWEYWNTPKHIMQWSHASDDWHTPHAENDLRVGGKFRVGYAAKDGSESFDFIGTYTYIIEYEKIEYTIADGRNVMVLFIEEHGGTKITEVFDTEDINTVDEQREGWQAILENFKKHVEKV